RAEREISIIRYSRETVNPPDGERCQGKCLHRLTEGDVHRIRDAREIIHESRPGHYWTGKVHLCRSPPDNHKGTHRGVKEQRIGQGVEWVSSGIRYAPSEGQHIAEEERLPIPC